MSLESPASPPTPARSLAFDFDSYPYLTAELPPVRGKMRVEVPDFNVEEVAEFTVEEGAETPHLLIQIEKRDLTTHAVLDHLRIHLKVDEHAVGHAGLKDRRAITRQWLSIPADLADQLPDLPELPGMTILGTQPYTQKLQEGHLKGNRFRILLREPEGTAEQARAVMTALAARGVPNLFGPQRFGTNGDNAIRGLQLIRKGRGRSKRWLDKLMVNALQSHIFNSWLALRTERGLYDTVVLGDIAHKHATGGKFQIGDVEAEAPRAAAFEISATGPLLGKKYHEAQDDARAIEDEVLASYKLGRHDFFGSPGSRRPIRLPLADWAVEETPEGLWLSFFLPKGAYATAVLREVMKTNPEAGPQKPEAPEEEDPENSENPEVSEKPEDSEEAADAEA